MKFYKQNSFIILGGAWVLLSMSIVASLVAIHSISTLFWIERLWIWIVFATTALVIVGYQWAQLFFYQVAKPLHDTFGSGGLKALLAGLNQLAQRSITAYQHLKVVMQLATNAITTLQNEGTLKSELPADLANLPMGKAISDLNQKLIQLDDEEQKRNWAISGLASFGDVLREHTDNYNLLCDLLVSKFAKYLNVSQVGLFVLQQNGSDEPTLSLKSAYAYNRKKYVNRSFGLKESLLGQSLLDGAHIYIDDVPEGYQTIKSGLGESKPGSVLIVPLIYNGEWHGAIEISALRTLLPHEIEFMNKLAEGIASTLRNIHISQHTKQLLEQAEQSNAELAAREEELRQNAEEMAATQEEMQRQSLELSSLFQSINTGFLRLEFNENQKLIDANENFVQSTGYKQNELFALSFSALFEASKTGESIQQQWAQVVKGNSLPVHLRVNTNNGSTLWMSATLSPVKGLTGQVIKVLMLGTNTTAQKMQEEEFKKLSLVTDNTNNAVVITDKHRRIEYVNKGFTDMTGYTMQEVLGKVPGQILQGPETDKETVLRIRAKLDKKEPIFEEILNYKKTGEPYWISVMINPVFDENGQLEKFISVQANITETKNKALDFALTLDAVNRNNCVIEFTPEMQVISSNKLFYQLTGLATSGLQLHGFESAVSNDHQKEHLNRIWPEVAQGQTHTFELELSGKEGQITIINATFSPIYNTHHEIKKILMFGVDITEQKQLQQLADQKEQELKAFAQAVDHTVGSVYLKPDLSIEHANTIFCGITGFEIQQLEKKPFVDLLPNTAADQEKNAMLLTALKQGKFFEGEFQITDANGNVAWFQGTFNPVLDLAGRLTRVVVLAQFTTDIRQQMADMRGYIDAYQNAMPIIEFNTEGGVVKANKLFYDHFGFQRKDLMKKNLSDFFNAISKEAFSWQELIDEIGAHQSAHRNLLLKTKGEQLLPVVCHLSAMQDSEGKIQRIICITTEQAVPKLKVA